jgi:hypothetical protein
VSDCPPSETVDLTEIERIMEDMKKAGFPLEVIAGTRFASRGWHTRHQVFFHDVEQNKSRYVDISAHKAIDISGRFKRLNYTVIAECKKSDKPWVFYTPPTSVLVEEKDITTLGYVRAISKPVLKPDELKFLLHNHYVSKPPLDRLAVASYIAFSGNKDSEGYDQIFAATNQTLKALQYQLEKVRSWLSDPLFPNILIVYYPLIIFEGRMYEYVLNEKDEPRLTETHYVKYEVAFQSQTEQAGSSSYLVDVVTRNFLPEYIDILEEEFHRTAQSA